MNVKEIKHRISGASETVKITGAMQLIASSKMFKLGKRLESSLDFYNSCEDAIKMIGKVKNPLLNTETSNDKTFIVIASDKGLCGDFNHSLLNYAEEQIKSSNVKKIYAVGQYCRDYFMKKGVKISNAFVYVMQDPIAEDAIEITERIIKDFIYNKSEVDVVYTRIDPKHLSSTEIVKEKLLPIELSNANIESCIEAKEDVEQILKQYIWSKIYFILCSSSMALNYKRMMAMQQATQNGKELEQELKTQYNKVRQEKITSELIEAGIAKQALQNN